MLANGAQLDELLIVASVGSIRYVVCWIMHLSYIIRRLPYSAGVCTSSERGLYVALHTAATLAHTEAVRTGLLKPLPKSVNFKGL